MKVPVEKALVFPATPGFGKWRPLFIAESIAHPAKINLNLLRWILETYTKPGDVVLDPMAGTGSTIIMASLLGRHGITVELELNFYRMMVGYHPCNGGQCWECQRRETRRNGLLKSIKEFEDQLQNPLPDTDPNYMMLEEIQEAIWKKKGELADYPWDCHPPGVLHEVDGNIDLLERSGGLTSRGAVTCIHGDARELSKLMRERDQLEKGSIFNYPFTYSDSKKNIGNLPHGDIDAVITSPPYANLRQTGDDDESIRKAEEHFGRPFGRGWKRSKYSEDSKNIGNLPHGDIDTIVTSPPYEESLSPRRHKLVTGEGIGRRDPKLGGTGQYAIDIDSKDNVGNLKKTSYLEAMFRVYRECWSVLNPNRKMIIVVKNFIRDKKTVRLDLDTIQLCEAAGFKLVDRWWFKLPTRSFWRILYHRNFPNVPTIDYEDVLIFKKEAAREIKTPEPRQTEKSDKPPFESFH